MEAKLELTLLYYVNQVILMLPSIFQGQFPQQRQEGLSKQGQPQPHIHSKVRVLSSQL